MEKNGFTMSGMEKHWGADIVVRDVDFAREQPVLSYLLKLAREIVC